MLAVEQEEVLGRIRRGEGLVLRLSGGRLIVPRLESRLHGQGALIQWGEDPTLDPSGRMGVYSVTLVAALGSIGEGVISEHYFLPVSGYEHTEVRVTYFLGRLELWRVGEVNSNPEIPDTTTFSHEEYVFMRGLMETLQERVTPQR